MSATALMRRFWIFSNNPANATVTALPFTNGWTAFNNVFPDTLSDVLTMSPKGTTSMARDGDFVVQQPIDAIVEWKANSTIKAGSSLSSPAGCITSYMRVATSTGTALHALIGANGNNVAEPTLAQACDTPWQNFDWSYQMFDGLTANAPSTGSPYLTIKGFTGWECSASPHGSLLPFQRMLPLPDPEALQMAAGIFHARPDSLPSAANDWGTIGKVVMSALPAVGSWLTGLFGKKASSNIRNVAQSAINAIQPKRKSQPSRSNRNSGAGTPRALAAIRSETTQIQQLRKQLAAANIGTRPNQSSQMRRFTNTNASTSAATRPNTTTTKRPASAPLPQRQRRR